MLNDNHEEIEVVNNNSHHDCEACIHGRYCDRQTEESLKRNTPYINRAHTKNDTSSAIYVPDNCPVINPKKKERVVFT